ncbi:hypothetical protein MJ579_01660 [Klebsiella pneumoniae]|nr:hypothetical protein MJ579_01660 [Klebsiella pneumoniae]
MVEYFGEHLDGLSSSQNGWVQSYGSPLREAAGGDRRRQPSAN